MRMKMGAMAACAGLALTFLTASTWAEDKDAKSPEELLKALEEAGKPGPEHARLQPLVGSWSYTAKFWMDPSQPPIETKGTIERKFVLGNRFLEERVTGTGFDGKPGFEGLGLLGYDNGRKQYTSSWSCSMGTGTCLGLGTADESGTLTFRTESFCPVEKKTIKGREVIRLESSDKVVTETYVTEDGKERKMMELVAVRKR